VRRLLPLSLALLAAACSREADDTCPGEEVGTFLIEVSIPEDAATPLPICSAPLPGTPGSRVVATVEATIAVESSTLPVRPAALCVERPLAATYFGSRDADGNYTLGASSGIALLTGCGENCSAVATETLTGAIVDDGSGPRFTGTLVERFDARAGDCSCALPCTATYTLASVR
jgi:hypothetical protein